MRLIGALLLMLLVSGCASDPALARRLEFCCGPADAQLGRYRLELVAVPAFLVAPLSDELNAALTAKGWHETATDPDALVTLRFDAVYADRPLANDGFADPLASGGPRKFDARITLEIRRASDGAEVLRGTLMREHTEFVGTYDHHRARPALRAGFDALLKRLPRA